MLQRLRLYQAQFSISTLRMKWRRALSYSVLVGVIASMGLVADCGGGGSGAGSPIALPPNRASSVNAGSNSITFTSDQSVILTGKGQTYQFNASGPGALTFSSSNPSMVEVDSTGKVTAVCDSGSAVITVSTGTTVAYATAVIAKPSTNTLLIASSSVLSVSATGAVLQNNSANSAIKSKDIVVSGDKGGLLATVQTVTVSGGQIALTTTPASLADAFPNMVVDLEISSPNLTGTVSKDQAQFRYSDGRLNDDISIGKIECEGGLGPPTFKFATLELNPFIKWDARTHALEAGIKPNVNASASTDGFSASAGVEGKCEASALETLPIVGIGPLLFAGGSLLFTIGVKAEASASVSLPSLSATLAVNPRVSARLDATGVATSASSLTPTTTVEPAAFTAPIAPALNFSIGPFMRFDVGLAANPGRFKTLVNTEFFYVQPSVGFDATIRSPLSKDDIAYTGPEWKVDGDVAYGVELSLRKAALSDLLKYFGISIGPISLTVFDPTFIFQTSPKLGVSAIPSADGCSVDLGASGLSGVGSSTAPATVNWIGFKNGATSGTILTTNVATGNTATGTWKVGPSDTGSYKIASQAADGIWGAIGLPYSSGANASVTIPASACPSPSPSPSSTPPAGLLYFNATVISTPPDPESGLDHCGGDFGGCSIYVPNNSSVPVVIDFFEVAGACFSGCTPCVVDCFTGSMSWGDPSAIVSPCSTFYTVAPETGPRATFTFTETGPWPGKSICGFFLYLDGVPQIQFREFVYPITLRFTG